MLEEPATQLLIVVSFMLLVGTSLASLLVAHGRRWVFPPDSFDGSREAHGVRVRTTIKAGELVFHGIALKASATERKTDTNVVPFPSQTREPSHTREPPANDADDSAKSSAV
jgi:hypothetical protein